MKLSVSLSESDLAILERYMVEHGLPSRSAAVQRAIKLLDARALAAEYAAEFADWEETQDRRLWDSTISDGLPHEAW